MTSFAKILVTVAALAAPVAASAVAVTGGNTSVAVGSLVSGLTLGTTGTATFSPFPAPTVTFKITGGTLDNSLSGQILHAGSGITLRLNTTVVGLSNFTINTATQFLTGDVTLNGVLSATNSSLFSFNLNSVTTAQLTNLSNPQLALIVTPTTSLLLTNAFGLAATTGRIFGTAATSPILAAAVPEPATWALLIVGFAMVGTAVRRRATLALAA